MLSILSRALLILGLTVLIAGGKAKATPAHDDQGTLNDGYSLFYDFCNQEKDLGLLLYVKTTTPEIADYMRRISAAAKDDMATLTQFGVANNALQLKKASLPGFEVEVRKSMADERKHRLIFGTSGAAYSQAVLMTQSEVTNYGLNVAKILSEQEPDSKRAGAMRRIYAKWSKFHEEAYRMSR